MLTDFSTRLRALTGLDETDIDALLSAATDRRSCASERQFVSEGDRPERLHILIDGWAARVKWLPDGTRHLCALLVPGDVCDIDGLHVQAYDYGVLALNPCQVATIDREAALAFCDQRPEIGRVLTWLAFVDNSMLNEHATSLARRSARERIAHLFCELQHRLDLIGRAGDGGYDMLITQDRMADLLGLTAVHVNRTIQNLRSDGLIRLAGRRLVAPDWKRLQREAGFTPGYLHLEGMRRAAA